jgi:hypothetical protein
MRLRLFTAAAALAVFSTGLAAAPAVPSSASGVTPVLFGLTDKWKDQISADDNQLQIRSGVVDMFQSWVATSQQRTTVGNWFTWVRGRGAAPMLTLQPPSSASLASINRGTYDAQLRAWGRTFAQFQHPVFFRLFPEMNQKSHTYSPGYRGNTAAQFRTAWRHVVSVVRSAGGTNVSFIWCPYRVYATSTPLKSLWPGASYVNWVAFDAYNYHDASHAFAWPAALFNPTAKAIRAVAGHKPLMIAEVGATTDTQKPTWVAKSVPAAQAVGAKIMLWFDQRAEHNWRLDSSSAVLRAARNAVHSNAVTFAGRVDGNSTVWSIDRIDSLVATGS